MIEPGTRVTRRLISRQTWWGTVVRHDHTWEDMVWLRVAWDHVDYECVELDSELHVLTPLQQLAEVAE